MLHSLKRWAKEQPALYNLVHSLRDRFSGLDEASLRRRTLSRAITSLQPEGSSRGNVLVSYINDPFLLKRGQPITYNHTHDWESWRIVQTFLELGFAVDVISWTNKGFVPQKAYMFFVDARMNLERMVPLLNKGCVKVMHIDTAHWLFHITAQHRRLLDLQQRKGVTLTPWKVVQENRGIECADCATILGNEFTMGTYRYAQKPLYPIPVSTTILFPWPDDKDFEVARNHFLWFGSEGMVHKGLDLVLDAFAGMPECQLTICGPVSDEKAFEQVYHRELYDTPNIHTVGWVDISTPKFREIVAQCVGLVYPSCSEGQCGAAITCLHAGLIPLISHETGLDVTPDFGTVLKDCSIDQIRNEVRRIANLPAQELKAMARKSWEFARANHTRERFAEVYRTAVESIMTAHGL